MSEGFLIGPKIEDTLETAMDFPAGGAVPPKQYALVSYIPDPLGAFLDQLRLELVPECSPHAHVTILPPRPIQGGEAEATGDVLQHGEHFANFKVELGDVEIFPVSKVVFIGIRRGEEELREMYRALNRGTLSFREPYPYHPHITLAQNFEVEELERISDLAKERWAEYPGKRNFTVDSLDFVKNLYGNKWIDLANVRLKNVPAGVTI